MLSRANSTSTNSLSSSYSSDYASENLSDLGCNLNDILVNMIGNLMAVAGCKYFELKILCEI